MKANEAEKIYVHVRANKELGTTWHGKKITNSDIEYVRKDAFIEKAVNWLRNNMLSYVDVGMDYESMELNLKFYNDFKKAMKGENK